MEYIGMQNTIEVAVRAFHEKLDQLQFHSNVNESRVLVVDQDPYGFGASLSRRMLGLQFGYIFNRTVVFCRPNDPPYVTCYEPTGKISFDEIKHLPISTFDFNIKQDARIVRLDFNSFYANRNLRSWFYHWIPPEFSELSLNRLFFDGQILSRFKLLNEFQSNVEVTKEKIGFKTPIIGMHIRRGDKVVDHPYIPLKISLNALKNLSGQTGIHRVFVTSDNEKIFEELPQNLGLEYIFDKQEKRYNNANHSMLIQEPHLQKDETFTATKILELLSHCDGIVGLDNAHFSTLAAAKITARTSQSVNVRLIRGTIMESFTGCPMSEWNEVLKFKILRLLKRQNVICQGIVGLGRFIKNLLRVILPGHFKLRA